MIKIRGFQLQASIAAILAGATSDLVANMTAQTLVPSNQTLVITGIATYTGQDAAAWGKLIWNFLKNGQIMDISLYNQSDQLGQQNQPLILGVPLIVEPGSLITVPVYNSDNVAHSAGVLMTGYYAR